MPDRYRRVAEIYLALQDYASKPTTVRALRAQLRLNGVSLRQWQHAYARTIEEGHVVAPQVGRPAGSRSAQSASAAAMAWADQNREAITTELGAHFTLSEFLAYCRLHGAPISHSRMARRILRQLDMRTVGQEDYDYRHD